jgi:hypothetical protein
MHLPFQEKMHIQEGAAGLLLQGEMTISRYKRKTNRAIEDATFETAEELSFLPDNRHLRQCLQHY